LPVRFSLFVLLLCVSAAAHAEWTGVEFEISDIDADWEFSDGVRNSKINSIGFSIEERAVGGLSVGLGIRYLTMRLDSKEAMDSGRFDAQNLELFLRQEFLFGESFALRGLLSYGYYSGNENVEEDAADINWSQVDLEIGASVQVANLRFTPFARYTDVDGDISGDFGTAVFELQDPYNYGLRFDIFIEKTAFIGIRLQSGSQSGGYLSFVRRY
jgi:hypothetical protein